MFRCAAGHQTCPGQKTVRVPTKVRAVEYRPINERGSVVGPPSYGIEVIKEQVFCSDHAPTAEPIIMGSIKQVFFPAPRPKDEEREWAKR